MTFYLAVATPTIGLMAADTRRTYPGLGGHIVDDPSPPKLGRLRGGWMTGSGVHQWLQAVHARLASLEAADTDALGRAVGSTLAAGRPLAAFSRCSEVNQRN